MARVGRALAAGAASAVLVAAGLALTSTTAGAASGLRSGLAQRHLLELNVDPSAAASSATQTSASAGSGTAAPTGVLPPMNGVLPPMNGAPLSTGVLPPMNGVLPPMNGSPLPR